MPSPIAHSVTGYAIARLFPRNFRRIKGVGSQRKLWVYGVLVAACPDLDFIPQILTGEKYHHGFTHSIVFALGFTAIAVLWRYVLTGRWSQRLLLLTLVIYGSHLLMDLVTQNSSGIQLLWPFSIHYFQSSWVVFPGTYWSKPFIHPGHIIFVIFELTYAAILITGIRFWSDGHQPTISERKQYRGRRG